MNNKFAMLLPIFGVGLTCLAAGCAKSPPPITEVEGIVLLNDAPLPFAHVEFVPDLKFGAELNSTATTDEAGKFRLVCNRKSEQGAVVATHWILVTEVAMPINNRERDNPDPEKERQRAEQQAKLTNRPIPTEYAQVGTTPLKIQVAKNQRTYEVKLVRIDR